MNLIDELKWRGLMHDVMPGTAEQLSREMTTGYIGFDPTADSLHIGHLVQVMLLRHLQRAGHSPIALIGGATGMIGDPSGKSEERNLMSEDELRHNEQAIKKQLERFIDFNSGKNPAQIVNNYDWFKDISLLQFMRNVAKHITVSYMMAKDSVQKRLESGLSFTEFSYQIIQGYDFYHLYTYHNCKLQMGGSDQWGNMVTGTELIRRMAGGEAYAITSPLITKPDGSKFGKTESGNVWLDPHKTSPYQFYQFWLNVADDEALKYLKIFTMFTQGEIAEAEFTHRDAPHERHLQKLLARELTIIIHSEPDFAMAANASEILFGKGTTESLMSLDNQTLLQIFDGVPHVTISRSSVESSINAVEFLADLAAVFPSRGEARKTIQAGGVAINKQKISDVNRPVTTSDLINNRYILLQRGKKNYHLVIVV